MPLNRHVRVPMPTKGIIRSRTGRLDVFKVLETFRKNGKPDNRRRCIGQYDPETDMLIPNNAYYEYYDNAQAEAEKGSEKEKPMMPNYQVNALPIGHTTSAPAAAWLVARILEDLGVNGILKGIFGEGAASRIIQVAACMVSRGNSIGKIADCYNKSNLSGMQGIQAANEMDVQSISQLFADIDNARVMEFFKQWAKASPQAECFAYDVPYYSRYGEFVGYLDMAVHVGRGTRLPVSYARFQEAASGKSHLEPMMQTGRNLGVENTLVLDCEFCNPENLRLLDKNGQGHVVQVEAGEYEDCHEEITADAPAREAIEKAVDELLSGPSPQLQAKSIKGRFFGVDATIHVFFDAAMRDEQDRRFPATYARVEEQLSQLMLKEKVLDSQEISRYSRFFDLDLASDGLVNGFGYSKAKPLRIKRYHGFLCLLSSGDMGPTEVLSAWRNGTSIGDAFYRLSDNPGNPGNQGNQANQGIQGNLDIDEGKLFCAFIGLMASMHMLNTLAPDVKSLAKTGTAKNAILELERITVLSGENRRLYTPLSQLQKDILGAFGLSEDDFVRYLEG